MVSQVSPEIKFIHAYPYYGVCEVTYDVYCTFKNTTDYGEYHNYFNQPYMLRVNTTDDNRLKAVEEAREYLGWNYNDIYSSDKKDSSGKPAMYCTQLVQTAYNEATKSNFFPSSPMNFTLPNGTISNYWKEYYQLRNISKVPEGQPGTSPYTMWQFVTQLLSLSP